MAQQYFENSPKAYQFMKYLKAYASEILYTKDDEDVISELEKIEEFCKELKNAYSDFVEFGTVADGDKRIPF